MKWYKFPEEKPKDCRDCVVMVFDKDGKVYRILSSYHDDEWHAYTFEPGFKDALSIIYYEVPQLTQDELQMLCKFPKIFDESDEKVDS